MASYPTEGQGGIALAMTGHVRVSGPATTFEIQAEPETIVLWFPRVGDLLGTVWEFRGMRFPGLSELQRGCGFHQVVEVHLWKNRRVLAIGKRKRGKLRFRPTPARLLNPH